MLFVQENLLSLLVDYGMETEPSLFISSNDEKYLSQFRGGIELCHVFDLTLI